MTKISTLILLLILLTSCGGSSSEDNSGSGLDQIVAVTEKEDEIEKIFKRSTVFCVKKLECPASVGKLTNYTRKSDGKFAFGVCSGTLVDKNTFLTNAHCIPPELRYSGAPCHKQIRVNFPSSILFPKAEVRKCDTVKVIYDMEKQADIAVISLEPGDSLRKPAKINRRWNPLNEYSQVLAYTMNPSGMTGYIEKKTFKLNIKENIFSNKYVGMGRKMLLTTNSSFNKVVKGNSGSGLFNIDGEIVGVVFARYIKRNILSHLKANGFNVFVSSPNYAYAGAAESISCLPSITSQLRPRCRTIRDYRIQNKRDFIDHLKEIKGLSDVEDKELYLLVNFDYSYDLKLKSEVHEMSYLNRSAYISLDEVFLDVFF